MLAVSKTPRTEDAVARLRDPALFREQAYSAGAWRAAEDGGVLMVTNPSTGMALGTVPNMGEAETREAVAAAHDCFRAWRRTLPQERGRILRRWYDLMQEHAEDLAVLMVLEQGKPLSEARGEIQYAAGFIEFYAAEAARVNAESVTPHLPDCSMSVRREPIGVVACVTPWNFPSAMITRKAAAALAAGCTVVVRPASETPYSALALAELAERAGFPAGAFSVLTGEPDGIVGTLCAEPTVRALSFTGSTQVGRKLLAQGAATVKKMSMELGGHAPFILYDDVPMDVAVAGAMAAKFATSGQDCLAANRIYVHRAVYEEFVAKFAEATRTLKVGDGFEDDVDIGPLMHDRAVAKCREHVEDARGKGARVVVGGTDHAWGGNYVIPTVLADVTPDMAIYREETFGPVAAIIPFDDGDDVIAMANDSEYGLCAYVYTRDGTRQRELVDGLEYGMVAVNRVKITGSPVPFGGVKQSGLGREGSRHGLEEFTELKYVCAS